MIDPLVSGITANHDLSYDCMYMEYNNQFYTHSEGGYINVSLNITCLILKLP
jgi:hypothetical protein